MRINTDLFNYCYGGGIVYEVNQDDTIKWFFNISAYFISLKMNIKYLTTLFFISLLMSACNSPIEYCATSETEQALNNLLTEQALQLTSAKKNDYYDGASIFGAIKIKATLAQIRISLENIKK